MPHHQREDEIRRLLQRTTGQPFRPLPPGHGGADLIPRFDHADAFDADLDGDAGDEVELFIERSLGRLGRVLPQSI